MTQLTAEAVAEQLQALRNELEEQKQVTTQTKAELAIARSDVQTISDSSNTYARSTNERLTNAEQMMGQAGAGHAVLLSQIADSMRQAAQQGQGPLQDRIKTQMLAKLTKPEIFDPNEKTSQSWRDWRIVLEAHCGTITEGAPRWLEAAASAADEQSVNDNIPMTTEASDFNRALNYLLTMLCRNEALTLVTNAKGSGFVA